MAAHINLAIATNTHTGRAGPLTACDGTQELGPERFWVSEALFGVLFGSFVLWIVSPFYTEHKSFYTVVVLRRLLVHLVCALLKRQHLQLLRNAACTHARPHTCAPCALHTPRIAHDRCACARLDDFGRC